MRARACVHTCKRIVCACAYVCTRVVCVCVCVCARAQVCNGKEENRILKLLRKQLFAKYAASINPFISQTPARVQFAVCGRSIRCTCNVKLRRVRITIVTIHQQQCVPLVLLLTFTQLLTIQNRWLLPRETRTASLYTAVVLWSNPYCCQQHHRTSGEVPLSDFNQIWIYTTDFCNSSPYQMSRKPVQVGASLHHKYRQTGR